ncbi:histone deacetylase family protein [Catenovulum sp. SM1970]|uniref:histone deacetylase family protein n=1 Tax=Marinifaba aquimaris TaxID=2741323 RepID=UPI001572076C|nr:histone deacetylase family protein [Marinifaba aquimaris]NTS78308.1 histone deacetylase family protein [Marinifaba aquimaris]
MTAAIISHYKCRMHKVPDWYAECPARLDVINNQLLSTGLDYCVVHKDAPLVTREQLERVHDADYLDELASQVPEEGFNMLSDDLPLSPKTLLAAQHAAGAGVLGVDLVMAGEHDSVFCNVRPPGHHAERKKAMGFCFYNNVAVAAAHALEHYGLKRVAIIDFDVHHGNGTQDIFIDDKRVLFFSSFQYPFFPETDVDVEQQNIVNIKLDSAAKSDEFKDAIEQGVFAPLAAFEPELILISAGFDAHIDDDMSSVGLVEDDYIWITRQIRAIADNTDCCRGLVSTLEGGYNLPALARSVVAHIKALAKL